MRVCTVVVILLHMKRTPESLIPLLLHFVHCLLNVLECKHQHNLWLWRMMKNMSKKCIGKLVWIREFLLGFSFNDYIFSLPFFINSHSYDNWCLRCKVDGALDSPPKAMTLLKYAETIAIAQASMSTPIPRTRTRRFSSQVKNFFIVETTEDRSIWINLFWCWFLFDWQLVWFWGFRKNYKVCLDAMWRLL